MVADDTLDLNIALSNQAGTPIAYVIASDLQGVLVDRTLTGDRIRDRLYDLEMGQHAITITATAEGGVQTTAAFSVEVLPIPPPVTILGVTVDGAAATVSWSGIDHPLFSGYTLRRTIDDGTYFTHVYSGDATTVLDEIPFGKDITYRVTAQMRNGDEYDGPVFHYASPVDRLTFNGAIRETALLAESDRLFVTVWDSDQLYVVNTSDWSLVETATLPGVPDAMLPSADRRELYIHLVQEDILRAYRIADLTPSRRIPLLGRTASTEAAIATRFALLGDNRIVYGGYGSLTRQITIAGVSTGDTLATLSVDHFDVPAFVGSQDGRRLFVTSGNLVEDYAISEAGATLRQRTIRNFVLEGQPFLSPDWHFLTVGREKYDPNDLSRQIGLLDGVPIGFADDGKTGVTSTDVIDVATDTKLLTLPGRTVVAAVDAVSREVYFTLSDASQELYRIFY